MFLSKNWYFPVQKALIYYTFNKSHHNSFILLVFSHVANFRYVANFRFLTLQGYASEKNLPCNKKKIQELSPEHVKLTPHLTANLFPLKLNLYVKLIIGQSCICSAYIIRKNVNYITLQRPVFAHIMDKNLNWVEFKQSVAMVLGI